MLKKLFFTLMAVCFVPFQAYAATTVVSDVSAINLVGQLTQNSAVTVTATAAVASVNQTGLVNAPLALGTVNLNPLTLPATGIMLTTGHITSGVGGNLALGGDADVLAVLGATPGFATTGTFDASSVQFSFTTPPGTTAVTMDLVFATNEVIGAVSPDTAVVMVDGVNKAVFNNGQLLSNQNAAFLFAAAPLGTIVSGYNNVSELNTLTALLDPLLTTHTVKIAIADNTDALVDSAIIVSNFMESTSTQEGMGIGDIFPPVITPQADVVAEATGPTTAVNLGAPTVTDNVDLNPRATAAPAGPYAVGITPVVWSSTDVAGNIGTAIQTVTITDTTAPTVTAPANATFAALTAAGTPAVDPAIAAWLASAVATDLVAAPVLVNDAPVVFPLGATLVTFTATDASGNIATATATVTITNQTPAVMTGPADLVVTATTTAGIPSSAFVIGYFLNSVTAVDNVDGVITPQVTHDAPAIFPVGATTPITTLVTWSVTNSGGITSTIQANVTVNPLGTPPPPASDLIPPVIQLNGNPEETILQNSVYLDAGAVARDNVDGAITAAIVTTNPVNTAVPGPYIVTYSVLDAAGNSATATRAVLVVAPVVGLDVLPPVVTAPADVVVSATDFQGIVKTDASLAAFFAGVVAVDNIGVLGAVTNNAPVQLPVGKTVVTFTAVDATGNSGTDTATITVSGTGMPLPVPAVDADADGIPDDWEIAIFGDLITANAVTDFDGDGLLDIDELKLGTDPTVANSNPSTTPGDLGDVVFPTNPSDTDSDGVIDALEDVADLLNPSIASGIPSANRTMTYSINAGTNILRAVSVAPVTLSAAPTNILSSFGILAYSVNTTVGATISVRITSSVAFGSGAQFYKVNAAGVYSLIPASAITVVSANAIDLTLTDGGALDLDGVANGVIVDPIAVGSQLQILGGGPVAGGAGSFSWFALLLVSMLIFQLRRKSEI